MSSKGEKEESDEETEEEVEKKSETIVEEKVDITPELLIKYRVNYGRRTKTTFSEKYIYKSHPRGFFLIDVTKSLERMRVAVKFLGRFPSDRVLICSAREYAEKGIKKMCELIGMVPITGRFLPGTLTNYVLREHREVSLVFVVDHAYDRQIVSEAAKMKIPIVSLCDTNSFPRYVDLTVPANNKGRTSLAVTFWCLTILYLRERGSLGEDEVVDVPIEDFMVS
ncbi:MAG: 30S ribosomal protein S2 [Nitrososphaeria archaeon]|nr:30S ribosomal protein S2 [Nitrososphaeria archaeon]NIN52088.1 30S ribosomal protein S2 [Nitrososphaeria archaeon]NIQ32550.1 30S ribosomal protein S2 [Nitrososphaeria archaeon]